MSCLLSSKWPISVSGIPFVTAATSRHHPGRHGTRFPLSRQSDGVVKLGQGGSQVVIPMLGMSRPSNWRNYASNYIVLKVPWPSTKQDHVHVTKQHHAANMQQSIAVRIQKRWRSYHHCVLGSIACPSRAGNGTYRKDDMKLNG
jgi:hypothetical protein